MAGSSMCPCSACYNSTTLKTRAPQTAAATATAASTKASAHPGRRSTFQRLRKPRSSDTMASDLVGLRSAAQPIAGSRYGGGGGGADVDDVESNRKSGAAKKTKKTEKTKKMKEGKRKISLRSGWDFLKFTFTSGVGLYSIFLYG